MFVYLLHCHVLKHTVSALLINVVFTSTLLKYIFFYFINSWYIYLQPIFTYVCTPCTYYVICLEKTGAHKPIWFPAPFVIIITIYVLYSRVIIFVDTALDCFQLHNITVSLDVDTISGLTAYIVTCIYYV